jgi:hypothetical protein
MHFPYPLSFIYVIISGSPNLASATPSLRGNTVIRNQEGQARPVFQEKPIGKGNVVFRSNHNDASKK